MPYQYSPRYQLVPGRPVGTGGLGFFATIAYVDNPTGQWWSVSGVQVPPYFTGVVIPLPSATQNPRVEPQTPAGFTSDPQAGEVGTIYFTNAPAASSSGRETNPAATAPAFVGAVSGNVGSPGPLVLAEPAGTSGRRSVLVVAAHNLGPGFAAPTITPSAGWTQIATHTQNNGANDAVRVSIFTRTDSGYGNTSVAASAPVTQISGGILVYSNTTGTTTAAQQGQGQALVAATVACTAPSGVTSSVAIQLNVWAAQRTNSKTFVGTTPASTMRIANLGPIANTAGMSVTETPLTALGSGQALTGTFTIAPSALSAVVAAALLT